MHGVRLAGGVPGSAKNALPLLALNSVTMLGAEIYGRSYGGGILKMEPREAAVLPLPGTEALERAWTVLAPHSDRLDAELDEAGGARSSRTSTRLCWCRCWASRKGTSRSSARPPPPCAPAGPASWRSGRERGLCR